MIDRVDLVSVSLVTRGKTPESFAPSILSGTTSGATARSVERSSSEALFGRMVKLNLELDARTPRSRWTPTSQPRENAACRPAA